MSLDLEHPDITRVNLTGYTLYCKPKSHYCEECGKDVERENNRERVRRYREKCNENLHTTK